MNSSYNTCEDSLFSELYNNPATYMNLVIQFKGYSVSKIVCNWYRKKYIRKKCYAFFLKNWRMEFYFIQESKNLAKRLFG